MKNVLYIIRGLPGSGKSTEAKRLAAENPDNFKIYEADDYFLDTTSGIYNFDATKLQEAHHNCQEATKTSLREGFNVIVSNTFSTLWELRPYQFIANKYNVELNIRQMNNSFKNIHNVPDEVIQKMIKRWQEYPNCLQIPPIINNHDS